MATKTIYVRDEDVTAWDKAKELAGESLSQLLTTYLKKVIAEKEAEANSLGHKIILRYRDHGNLPTAKSFLGRWIITPDEPYPMNYDDYYAVAITAKKNFVFFNFSSPVIDNTFNWGRMRVFPSLDAAMESEEIPQDIIGNVLERMGVEIEELNI